MSNKYQCLTNTKKFCVYHFSFTHSLFHQRNQLVWFHLICAFYKCVTNLSLYFLQAVYILIVFALLIVLVICQVWKLNLVAYNSSLSFLNTHLLTLLNYNIILASPWFPEAKKCPWIDGEMDIKQSRKQ